MKTGTLKASDRIIGIRNVTFNNEQDGRTTKEIQTFLLTVLISLTLAGYIAAL